MPQRALRYIATAVLLTLSLAGCSDGEVDKANDSVAPSTGLADEVIAYSVSDDGDTVLVSQDSKANLNGDVCVWNQAYQENYEPDALDDILENAEGCYVLLDPFDDDDVRKAIPDIRAKGNAVGCYISIGTCEDWRDDFDDIKGNCLEQAWGDWEGEYFVDKIDKHLVDAMSARIDTLAGWGCEFVEFDNMDWAYDDEMRQDYKFAATEEQAEAYAEALCEVVHDNHMLCMAKSTARGANDFDGITFESYPDDKNWWEPEHLAQFLDASHVSVIFHYNESDCDGAYEEYQDLYMDLEGDKISFLCEDQATEGYLH